MKEPSRTSHGGDQHPCGHGTPPEKKPCNQCRIEVLSDEDLLAEVEAYEAGLRANGHVPKGWWTELAYRLRRAAGGGRP